MALSSLVYLIFLALCTAVTYLVTPRARNFTLLLFSIGFFVWAMPNECLVTMIYVLVVYIAALLMGKLGGKARLAIYIAALTVSVGFLFTYKYLAFALSLFGAPQSFSLIAPIGISYVTFQSIAYLTEIKRENIKPESDPVSFFLYALFFAKLTAGPIEMPQDFLPQLERERRFSSVNAENGVLLIAIGFIKKLAIADLIAPGVDGVFSTAGKDGAFAVILATLLYSLQILADFSGYTDIARGSAMILGIRLKENFNKPYSSVSIREFWRRWHISLSDWLKNYIYIPLGGNRCSAFRRYLNVGITFLVSGIWHGASLNFIAWGALHGVYQIAEMLLEKPMKKLRDHFGVNENGGVRVALARVRTFILVAVAWVFFRAPDLSSALTMLSKLFTDWGSLTGALDVCRISVTGLLLVASAWLATKVIRREAFVSPASPKYEKNHSPARLITVLVLTAWAVALVYAVTKAQGGASSFIYFNF